jgi:hypothetical protein
MGWRYILLWPRPGFSHGVLLFSGGRETMHESSYGGKAELKGSVIGWWSYLMRLVLCCDRMPIWLCFNHDLEAFDWLRLKYYTVFTRMIEPAERVAIRYHKNNHPTAIDTALSCLSNRFNQDKHMSCSRFTLGCYSEFVVRHPIDILTCQSPVDHWLSVRNDTLRPHHTL